MEARGQIGSKLSLRTVIPGHVFWVGCTQDCDSSQRALSSRNTTAEETKIIPPPPSHSVASREMLYFLRFVFPLSRGSPSFGPPLFPREVVRLYFGRAWRFLDAAKEGSWRNESKVKQGKERGNDNNDKHAVMQFVRIEVGNWRAANLIKVEIKLASIIQ